jgi:hypothetical protein
MLRNVPRTCCEKSQAERELEGNISESGIASKKGAHKLGSGPEDGPGPGLGGRQGKTEKPGGGDKHIDPHPNS